MSTKQINILAIPGSLRNNSSSVAVLKHIAKLAPAGISFTIYEGLGSLPHFNDSNEAPAPVATFRKLLQEADGILICTPEYAFGLPGVLKNALDWTVSSGELVQKPVAVITAATGGDKAHASLLYTLTALSANVPESNTLLLSFIRSKLNEKGEISDAGTLAAVQAVMDSLASTILTGGSR